MRLDKDYTYLFHDIDRHGVRQNHTAGMLLNQFTHLTSFKPDTDYIYETLAERKNIEPWKSGTVYLKQCIYGKNGKHTGLFITSFVTETNLIEHFIEYEWWQNPNWKINQDPAEDEVRSCKVKVDPEFDQPYKVVVTMYKGVVKLQVLGIGEDSHPVDCMIDYSQSLMWCGTATGLEDQNGVLSQEFMCTYTGDMLLIHMQEASMTEEQIKDCFYDYDKFKSNKFDVRGDVVYISTNFYETTPLKARDYSGNGMHLLKYNKSWIG